MKQIDGYTAFNRMRFKKGFLYKFFSLKNIKTEGVIPDFDTVQKFSIPEDNNEYSDSDF